MQVERLPLDMASQTQQFYNWLMENKLKATEISLWHGLMHIADKAGYPVWLSVAVTTLEKITGMKKDAAYNAREKLASLGLIEVKPGKGNQAAKYRIIPFGHEILEFEDEVEEKGFEELPEELPDDPPEIEEGPPVKEEQKIKIFRRTQDIIPFPPSADIQHLKTFLDEGMEDALLCEAVDITLKEEKLKDKPPTDKWRYFKGIIRTWYNNGIKTYKEYEQHEKEREERLKNGGNRQNTKPRQSKPKPKSSGMREFRVPGE